MAWVRIHDGALTHPKVVGMFNPRDPFHLWIWGLSYSQMHLTDGYIPRDAVPVGSRKAEHALCLRGLWEPDERGGLRIHDYIDWNNSKKFVTNKRVAAKERMAAVRANTPQRTNTEHTLENERDVGGANVPIGVRTDLSSLEKEPEKKPFVEARSKRPVFAGQRVTVFEWMLDDLRQILGPYTEGFALDEWFYELDAKAMRLNLVMPKRDKGAWIQSQLLEEAARRGLKIAGATDDPYAKYPTAWQCTECGEIHEGTQEQGRKRACQKMAQAGKDA